MTREASTQRGAATPPHATSRTTAPAHTGQALQALYATVRSLAALQDVDEVLQTIVDNAHDLVETDVTHLSLVDPDSGQLFVRAVQGEVSPAFRSARISTDIGVAGRVLETGRPFSVTNYRAAREIAHDPQFDAIMRYEGLVALVGVPLTVGDDVIGVLHGAHRRARPFHDDEIALLSAFADHAAVALDNARLYHQKTHALSDLSVAYGTIEAHVKALERATVVHDAMTALVLSGGTAQDVAALLTERIERGVVILDRDDLRAAESGPDAVAWLYDQTLLQADGLPSPVLADAISQSAANGHRATFAADDGTQCSVVAVVAGESYLGALIVYGTVRHEADVRTIERAAQIIGLLTLQREAVLNAEEQVRGELVAELLSARTPATARQRERAAARDIELGSLTTLVVVACDPEQRTAASRIARRVAREAHGLAGEHLGNVVVLLPGRDRAPQTEHLHRALRAIVSPPLVLAAAPVDVIERPAREGFELALRATRLLLALGARDTSAGVADLAFYSLVLHPARRDDLDSLLERTLGPLRTHDRRGRSDLLGTVAAYFANSGNLVRTAADLHIHVNTLLKRIERVSVLIGSNWRDPDRAIELQLAVRLLELTRALDGTRAEIA